MKRFCVIVINCYLLIVCLGVVHSAEKKAQLIFPKMEVQPGQTIKIPITLDQVPNMAGIKLALTFDKKLLTYVKNEKTKITASLMHIVNDKHPGKLVIVMAGARGVPVNNQSVMNLFFQVNKNIPKAVDTKFKVIEIQLMSEALKELDCEFNISPIHILASKNQKTIPESKNQKTIPESKNQKTIPEKKDLKKKAESKTSPSDPKAVTPQQKNIQKK
ncbi:cellulosome anchoring protein [Candidatus Magnetomorum sp. HK-1]|nr:cellulosome anchoring protein [Candidatus Magnetomorum sp. HK-1]